MQGRSHNGSTSVHTSESCLTGRSGWRAQPRADPRTEPRSLSLPRPHCALGTDSGGAWVSNARRCRPQDWGMEAGGEKKTGCLVAHNLLGLVPMAGGCSCLWGAICCPGACWSREEGPARAPLSLSCPSRGGELMGRNMGHGPGRLETELRLNFPLSDPTPLSSCRACGAQSPPRCCGLAVHGLVQVRLGPRPWCRTRSGSPQPVASPDRIISRVRVGLRVRKTEVVSAAPPRWAALGRRSFLDLPQACLIPLLDFHIWTMGILALPPSESRCEDYMRQ